MKSLLIRLKAPLQAWSTQSRLSIRGTDDSPSKSGVLGLLGAALGMDRSDDVTLAKLAELELAVRVDEEGTLLRDYQTAGSGSLRGGDYFVANRKVCVTSERYYLQNADFLAAVSGGDDWIDELARALQSPRWPLFLGRRSCPPSVPVFAGVSTANAADAARNAAPSDQSTMSTKPRRLLVETTPDNGGEARYDVPISFAPGQREYALRHVRTEWLDAIPTLEEAV